MNKNILAIIVLVAVVIAGIFIVKYNGLVKREEVVEKAWAPLVMKLKERYASVPRLITDVTAYVGRKPELAKELESDLNKVNTLKTISDAVDFANQVETDLTGLVQWLTQRYPGIISRYSVRMIAETLKKTNATMGAETAGFNKGAEEYNSYARRFPNNIVAMTLLFPTKYAYFQPKSN